MPGLDVGHKATSQPHGVQPNAKGGVRNCPPLGSEVSAFLLPGGSGTGPDGPASSCTRPSKRNCTSLFRKKKAVLTAVRLGRPNRRMGDILASVFVPEKPFSERRKEPKKNNGGFGRISPDWKTCTPHPLSALVGPVRKVLRLPHDRFWPFRPLFLLVALDKLTEPEVDRRELFLPVTVPRNALEIALKIRRLR